MASSSILSSRVSVEFIALAIIILTPKSSFLFSDYPFPSLKIAVCPCFMDVYCLSLFRQLQQKTNDWMAYSNRNLLAHTSEGWKAQDQPGCLLVTALFLVHTSAFLLSPHMVEELQLS